MQTIKILTQEDIFKMIYITNRGWKCIEHDKWTKEGFSQRISDEAYEKLCAFNKTDWATFEIALTDRQAQFSLDEAFYTEKVIEEDDDTIPSPPPEI